MNWTDEQSRAVTFRGNNVLVSAGAGAGKTAVLVERIKKQVIDERVSITKILVVTFTNAAALEMKEKVRSAVLKELEATESGNRSERTYLSEQLRNFGSAYISTFHSFALGIIRKYYYICGLSPNFKVAEQEVTELLKQEALDNIFETEFDNKRKDFYSFNGKYSSSRNNYGARELIKSTYEFIQSLPDPKKWINEKIRCGDMIVVSDMIVELIIRKLAVAEHYVSRIMALLDESATPGTFGNYLALHDEISKLKQDISSSAFKLGKENYDVIGKRLSELNFSYMIKRNENDFIDMVKEDIKLFNETAKEQIARVVNDYFVYSYDEYQKTIEINKEDAKTLKRLVFEFDEEFTKLKRNENIIDFSDIEHIALKILADEEISEDYRNQFEYIYIDEYQDSNLVQEEIINRIKKEDNLFMVGDVKQSIYKFRLAEPEIFVKKMHGYKNDESFGHLINLSTNFRSQSPILKSVNYMFSKIMNSPQSGVRYGEEEKLTSGLRNDQYEEMPVELYQIQTSEISDTRTYSVADEEIKELKTVEIDARLTAKVIKENIGREYYNSKENRIKRMRAGDIVVLLRSVSNRASVYQEALENLGIFSFIDESEGYFNTIEIQIFVNLLKVIDNRNQDIALISVLRSPIFSFSIDELAKVRIFQKKGSYFDSLCNYKETGPDRMLRNKVRDVFFRIDEWKKDALFMTLESFIWKLYDDTGYYNYVSALPMGERRKKNLDLLAVRGRNFQQVAISGIYGFLSYIDMLSKKKINIQQAAAVREDDDVVRIMTVHKSKGLEFPMVVAAGLGIRLGGKINTDSYAYHNELGVGLKPTDPISKAMPDNLMYKIINYKNSMEALAEEQRVLYVALTRARDKLVMVGADKKIHARGQISYDFSVETEIGNSYLSWIAPLMADNPYGRIKYVEPAELIGNESFTSEKNYRSSADIFESLKNNALKYSGDDFEEVEKKLSFAYKTREQDVKSRYSVSELISTGIKKNNRLSDMDKKSFDDIKLHKDNMTAAERGILVHLILELISFRKIYEETSRGRTVIDAVKEQIEELISQGRLDREKTDSISYEQVAVFFETEAGKLILSGYEPDNQMVLYKERSFVFKKFLERESQEITVIGKIDCLANIAGKWYIVDYKTDTVNLNIKEDERNRLYEEYRDQLSYYKEAIENSFGEPVCEVHLISLSLGESIRVF